MGSLMAGWDSPAPDPKLVRYRRNQSLTKEEIDAYWRQKRKNEEEHLKAIASPSDKTQEIANEYRKINFQRSSSLPLDNSTKKAFLDLDKETSQEKFMNKNCWWTRSNWAFLNEPPVLESHSNSYASQFHIANVATPKSNTNAGISTH